MCALIEPLVPLFTFAHSTAIQAKKSPALHPTCIGVRLDFLGGKAIMR